MLPEQPQKLGLREKKKRKTRIAIQQEALRLFQEQGYQATTIEQIAEAAEVSPSTFFRYFPTKESLVLEDEYDHLLIHAFRNQPSSLNPLQALRAAIQTGFTQIPDEEQTALRKRMELAMSVPELRAASLKQLTDTLQMIAALIAEREGLDSEDFHVLSFSGAFVGVIMSVQVYFAKHPEEDYLKLFDKALAHLETGVTLTKK